MRKLILLFAVLAPLLLAQGKKKIVAVGLTEAVARELRSVTPDAEIVSLFQSTGAGFIRLQGGPRNAQEREELLRAVADADGYLGMASREVVQAAKKLKWVQAAGAGVETMMFPEMVNSDIVLTNFQKIASPAIADHAMGMLLALTRELTYYISHRTQEEWARPQYNSLEVQGMTAVVIGVGGIGSAVSVRAWAAGMRVIGVDPEDVTPSPFIQRTVYPDRLDSVLPEADVVFVCAPDTPRTRNMMGQKQFDLLKKGSYFIAVSRGPLYSMDALVGALKSGQLAGAGVDVTSPEPLPKGHPLWKFENVIITPHIATRSQNEGRRQIDLMKENIGRFVRGEPLKYVVDKQKGY